MKIIWDKVTKFSQIFAIIIFVTVFFTGISLGKKSQREAILGEPVARAIFNCADNKTIESIFYKNFVHLETKSLRVLYLPQTISASGARYATSDEKFVFWNKGNTAFITENGTTTFDGCVTS